MVPLIGAGCYPGSLPLCRVWGLPPLLESSSCKVSDL